jgi:hypothetical protein
MPTLIIYPRRKAAPAFRSRFASKYESDAQNASHHPNLPQPAPSLPLMPIVVTGPPELQLGHPLVLRVHLPRSELHPSCHHWLGVFPTNVPSNPGLSSGRWLYLANAAGPDSASDNELQPLVYRTVTFPPTSLPPHAGHFEARFHRNNSYKVECRHPFVIVQGPLLRWRRLFLCVLLIGFTWVLQNVLNAKGTCSWKDPATHADTIDDMMYVLHCKPASFRMFL